VSPDAFNALLTSFFLLSISLSFEILNISAVSCLHIDGQCELEYSEWEKTLRDRAISFFPSLTLDQKISRERAMYDMYMYSEVIANTSCVRNCNRTAHERATMLIIMTITIHFLKVNFQIQTLHRNISAHRTRREKIKTFLLYISNSSYWLRLFRTLSVQSLLRFNNHERLQIAAYIDTVRSRDAIHMVNSSRNITVSLDIV